MPNRPGDTRTIPHSPSRLLKRALTSIVVPHFFQCCSNKVEGIRRRVALENKEQQTAESDHSLAPTCSDIFSK